MGAWPVDDTEIVTRGSVLAGCGVVYLKVLTAFSGTRVLERVY
jgi:hypothetical protein